MNDSVSLTRSIGKRKCCIQKEPRLTRPKTTLSFGSDGTTEEVQWIDEEEGGSEMMETLRLTCEKGRVGASVGLAEGL